MQIVLFAAIGVLCTLIILSLVGARILLSKSGEGLTSSDGASTEPHAETSQDSQSSAMDGLEESSELDHSPTDPLTDNPLTDNPLTDDPLADNPLADNPLADNPLAGDPLADDPLADDPLADDPLTDDPLTDDPLTDDPLTDDPLTDDPLADDPSTTGGSSTSSTHVIKRATSSQLVTDWISDPLSIFCQVELEPNWMPDKPDFFIVSGTQAERERMIQSSTLFPKAWSGIRTCRLDLSAFSAIGSQQTLPIATAKLKEMDVAIALDQASRTLYMKLRWRRNPSQVADKLMPNLCTEWRNFEKNSSVNRKTISKLTILNATPSGMALRSSLQPNFIVAIEDLRKQGLDKINRLENLRLSLGSFESKTLSLAQTRINECEYKIMLATTIRRDYTPPNGVFDGFWEPIESWRGRIAAAQQPFIAMRQHCLQVRAKMPSEILSLDDMIQDHCREMLNLQKLIQQFSQQSPIVLTLPQTIEWNTNNGAVAVMPLVVECHLK